MPSNPHLNFCSNKVPWLRRRHTPCLGACVLGLAFSGIALLQAQEFTPPAKIDVSQFPAAMVDDVVVPVPSEVFTVLDKLGNPNWRGEMRPSEAITVSDQSQLALALGTVVADGFIAVQAQDTESVKEVGKEVLRLSGAINVRESVLPHCNAIMEAADRKDWPKVRKELDKAQQNVRQAMIELRSEQLAQLVSLGGWLRGTEVLTSIVGQTYTEDGSELLRQPMLIKFFEERLGSMPERMKKQATVSSIQKQLQVILPLVDLPEGATIPKDSVLKINTITRDLVKQITDKGV